MTLRKKFKFESTLHKKAAALKTTNELKTDGNWGPSAEIASTN